MIFHNGALIEANSTMPTPVAMSTSEAEYMAACSATMATAHICMLLFDMLYLGTKQWHISTQRLPTTPAILMIDNEATVQIAKNGKLTRKTHHIECRFHFVRQGQQDSIHQLHWIPCDSQLADILTKTQLSGKLIQTSPRSFASSPIICFLHQLQDHRSDPRGVLEIYYCTVTYSSDHFPSQH